MVKIKSILFLLFLSCLALTTEESIVRDFMPSGRIDGMVSENSNVNLTLIQLNLKNDSLYQIADSSFPGLDLLNGPATYHRIIESEQLIDIQAYLADNVVSVIREDYNRPDQSRLYWVEVIPGNQPYGTYTADEAIEYTCSCIDDQANDCVKLGYDESWYNPFDYYGEAWWGFSPPYYNYIQEVRVTVRGAQCDDLPLWSETYMGLKNDNGDWSGDYELSINYTDNIFIVPEIWNQGLLMPTIGSEDNYVVDHVKFEFFYTCIEPEAIDVFQASDGASCSTIDLNWDFPTSDIDGFQIFKEGSLIFESNNLNDISFTDYSVSADTSYEYCIYTYNDCGLSSPVCNIGYAKPSPSPTNNIVSSNGVYNDQIHIYWDEAENSEGYRLYRDGAWLTLVYPHQDLEYFDEYIEDGEIYNYCVESFNECGDADWVCDQGFSGLYLGDSNFDGNIDVLDVVTLVNIILLVNEPNDDQVFWLDMNQDATLNVQDVVLLVNIILG